MLVVEPSKRISMKDILQHPFVSDSVDSVVSDLKISQVPKSQTIPLDMIFFESNNSYCNPKSEGIPDEKEL